MFLLLPFFSLLPFVSSISDPPRVSTLYGPVRGYTYTADAGFEAEIFKRIPYAKPPLGDGRWHKPVAPDKWAIELDATVMGPACASSSKEQHPLSGYSEDCLHINVYTSEACRKSPSGCAVVVYAHGGALLIDSPVLFEDEPLVNSFVRNDVVLVTVGYRLGVFGTLALGDENALPANLGLHDFIAALRFTREIIAEFGGDVDRITLMGHSSGGEMALEAALSPAVSPPGVKPLFSSVISMSGLLVLQSEEEQIMKTRKFALAAGCSGSAAEIIPCLHTKTTEEILTAQGATGGAAPMGDEQLGRIVMTGELFPIRRQLEVLENPVPPFRLLLLRSIMIRGAIISSLLAVLAYSQAHEHGHFGFAEVQALLPPEISKFLSGLTDVEKSTMAEIQKEAQAGRLTVMEQIDEAMKTRTPTLYAELEELKNGLDLKIAALGQDAKAFIAGLASEGPFMLKHAIQKKGTPNARAELQDMMSAIAKKFEALPEHARNELATQFTFLGNAEVKELIHNYATKKTH